MKKLLFSVTKKDFEMQTFRSGGPGGQNQNKVNSGVRLIHKDSGAVGISRTSRKQIENKKLAFQHLYNSPKFKIWLKVEIAKRTMDKQELEKRVNKMMSPENLLIEEI